MDEIAELATLATVAGATVGAGVLTQFIKVLAPSSWGHLAYRRISAVAGVVLLLVAVLLTSETFDAGLVLLATINGMIAGTAASAGYDVVKAATARGDHLE